MVGWFCSFGFQAFVRAIKYNTGIKHCTIRKLFGIINSAQLLIVVLVF